MNDDEWYEKHLFHSAQTSEFIKEFPKVYNKISKPLDLMLTYRAFGGGATALSQAQCDILDLCKLLIDFWSEDSTEGWLKDSLGRNHYPRTAFLFEMAEYSLRPFDWKLPGFIENAKRPPCGIKMSQHLSHYKENRGTEIQAHVRGFTLEMLREYDAANKTKHCTAWKNFLQRLVERAFQPSHDSDGLNFPLSGYQKTANEEKVSKLPAADQEMRLRLLESYEQAASGGRSSNFSHSLGPEMDASIKKFLLTANPGWRTLQNRDQSFRSYDSQFSFHNDALKLASNVMKLDQQPNEKAIQLLCDIAPSLGLYGYTPAEIIELVEQQPSTQEIFQELPATVKMMEAVQELTKANEANLAKHLLFNLVVCFCKADGVVSKEEENLLKTFANTIFGKNESETFKLGILPSSTKTSLDPPKPSIKDQPKPLEKDEPKPIPREESKPLISQNDPNPVMGGDLSTEKSIAQINALVGLEKVKADVQQLVNFTRIQQIRRSKGMKMAPATRHMLFYGNPGTGKTTVARLISQIYKDLGVVSKGHLIECDRSGLIGAFAGQTAIKVSEVVTTAVGGVLFIDEAYSLNQGSDDAYGLEAIDTLVKLMEDNRDDLVVIAAGYPDKMATFVGSNPGMRSRFNRVFSFDDYKPDQLLEIFTCLAKGAGYNVADDASECLAKLFEQMYKDRDESFGNGRDVRNVFEAAMSQQANRLVTQPDVSADALSQIILEDVAGLTDAASFKSSRPASSFGFQATKI